LLWSFVYLFVRNLFSLVWLLARPVGFANSGGLVFVDESAEQASAIRNRLLPAGTLVRLLREANTDARDRYGRLLRYVFRVRDGLNVNVRRRRSQSDACSVELAAKFANTVLLARAGNGHVFFAGGLRGRMSRPSDDSQLGRSC
jgi:hypothetical protein